jgi:hypothetical protein
MSCKPGNAGWDAVAYLLARKQGCMPAKMIKPKRVQGYPVQGPESAHFGNAAHITWGCQTLDTVPITLPPVTWSLLISQVCT